MKIPLRVANATQSMQSIREALTGVVVRQKPAVAIGQHDGILKLINILRGSPSIRPYASTSMPDRGSYHQLIWL